MPFTHLPYDKRLYNCLVKVKEKTYSNYNSYLCLPKSFYSFYPECPVKTAAFNLLQPLQALAAESFFKNCPQLKKKHFTQVHLFPGAAPFH